MTAKLGFIGTGKIGNPMARKLVEAGHDVTVFDLHPAAATSVIEAGASWADGARAVAAKCRIVFTSLPDPAAVEAVVAGPNGILAGARSGDIHVDLSTNSFDMVRRLFALEREAGVALIDAPVSGGRVAAEQGNLSVMASGDPVAFESAKPFLLAFGGEGKIFHLGDSGAGTLAKLVNNQVFLCAGLLLQEGLVMASKAGLDIARLMEVVKASSAGMYAGMADVMLQRRFDDAFFSLALAEKDVSLALDSARDLDVSMPVTQAAHQTYLQALSKDLGEKVFFATLLAIEEAADTRVG